MMSDICYFCGKAGADTKEDIPPKSFFLHLRDVNLIKVPAHLECNQCWGDAVEYARNLFSGLSLNNFTASMLLTTKGWRSLNRKPSLRMGMRNELCKNIEIRSSNGILLDSVCGVQPNRTLLDRFVNHIVRGLYYYHKKISLSQNISIKWQPQPKEGPPRDLRLSVDNILHPEVFRYRYAILDDYPDWSTWVLGFYNLDIGTILAVTGRENN